MPFTLHITAEGTSVASDDDWEEFDAILDRYEDHPPGLERELHAYLRDHPGHVDALAHLIVLADNAGETLTALGFAQRAREAIDAAVSAQPGAGPLEWARIENRPVLRLVRHALLAAWAAQDWELTDSLAGHAARLDPDPETARWREDIVARRSLEQLRAIT